MILRHINLSSSIAPRGGGVGDRFTLVVFCKKLNSKQLLFEAFLDVMRFFGSVQPKSESIFPIVI